MLRYKTKTRPGLVTLYDIRPGNGAGLFLQPRSPHGATSLAENYMNVLHVNNYGKMSSNDHCISPCSELVSKAVLNVHNVKSSVMALAVCHKTDTAQVMTTSDHAHIACHQRQDISLNTLCSLL